MKYKSFFSRTTSLIFIALLTACASQPIPELGSDTYQNVDIGYLAVQIDSRYVGMDEGKLANVSCRLPSGTGSIIGIRLSPRERNDLRILELPVGEYICNDFIWDDGVDTRMNLGKKERKFIIQRDSVTYIGKYVFTFYKEKSGLGLGRIKSFDFHHENNLQETNDQIVEKIQKISNRDRSDINVVYQYPFE